jgi:hypothetical protein
MKTPDEKREYMRRYMAERRLDPVQGEKNREASRKWRAANREKGNTIAKAWRDRNPERVKELNRAWCEKNARYKAEYQKAEYRRVRRSTHLGKKFGLTEEQYEARALAQGGHCALCSYPDIPEKRLAVDHCHKTGAVRMLLCADCNRGLGLFKDDPKLLRDAAAYVEAHQLTSTDLLA